MSSADYSVCNFEAPITGYGEKQRKSGPHLSQPAETISGLKRQGFDLLLLANNHSMDFGADGLAATLEASKSAGMDALGAGQDSEAAYSPLIKDIGGVRVGLINACEAQFGVIDQFERVSAAGYAWINHPKIDKTIIDLRRSCDFVIVFSHAGLEHYSIPQKEWRARYKHFCDLGADAVLGSHPHLPQGYEEYNGSLIFYSLGNFYFDALHLKDAEHPSFSVWLELTPGERVSFRPVFHYKKNGFVDLAPADKQVNIANLCAMLGENYLEQHERMSMQAYQVLRRRLILSLMPIPYDGTLRTLVRASVAKLLGKRKKLDKDILQLHLLRNEAYYFAMRHALELMVRDKSLKE
ncbi:MAG: CapA family protein [Proteobacteria bacterium]|nr:CapA family protein [Pseudomonadota bacterium]